MTETDEIDLTLFVACYNEEANIGATLDTLLEALAETTCSWEIIVIDDGSADDSPGIVERYIQKQPDLPIRLVVNEENLGLAQNYIEAAFLGRGHYYRLICGDNVEPKETFVTVFRHLGEAEIIIPYQVACLRRSWVRRFLSLCYTRMVNGISGYRIRYYNGLAVHTRYNVMRWHTNYHGFGFQADMITRLLDIGKSYVEVPVRARERTAGKANALTLRNFLSMAHFFLDLAIRRVGRSMLKPGKRA